MCYRTRWMLSYRLCPWPRPCLYRRWWTSPALSYPSPSPRGFLIFTIFHSSVYLPLLFSIAFHRREILIYTYTYIRIFLSFITRPLCADPNWLFSNLLQSFQALSTSDVPSNEPKADFTTVEDAADGSYHTSSSFFRGLG